jgi:hypothetical protein
LDTVNKGVGEYELVQAEMEKVKGNPISDWMKFRGTNVFLHLCLEPPDDAQATEIVDFSGDGGPVVRDKE